MEYKMNKIDTDLRQKINDATKEGLVHGTKDITVNKDKQNEKKQPGKYKLKQQDKNNKLLVDVTNAENVEVDAFKEESERVSKGIYLDIKR